MATYKVLADSYINDRLVPASTDDAPVLVAYEGNPGTNLEPVDDEGRARQASYLATKGRTAEEADRLRRALVEDATAMPPPASAATHHVPIPGSWHKLGTDRLLSLAARLGAPVEVTTRAAAEAIIRAELARRAGK